MTIDARMRRRLWPRELPLGNFAGGLNLRDAPTELAANESPDLWNVTFDERGGLQKRLGFSKKNPSPFTTSSAPQNVYVWKGGAATVTQCGADLFKDSTVGSVKTFSSSARVGLCEFGSKVYAIHPVDGVYQSSDAISWTHIANSPAGTCITPWQTRLVTAGDPSNPTRISACALNDPTDWSTGIIRAGSDMVVTHSSATVTSATAAFVATDVGKTITVGAFDFHIAAYTNATTITLSSVYTGSSASGISWSVTGDAWTNDIREGNDGAIVALSGAQGVDIIGRPGLLVFKRGSTHRVYDSTSGAYTTIDTAHGAASAISVVDTLNATIVLSEQGVFVTNGVKPLELMSEKLQPLFQETAIAVNHADLFCAGAKGDRVHFSLPRAGSTANDLHLEFHPLQGWFTAGSDAASCYATDTAGREKLYAGSPTVHGQLYEMGVTGADDSAAIECRYQTKWVAPAGGIDCQFTRLRVFGRGLFDLYVNVDFGDGDGDLYPVALVADSTLVWGVGTWGDYVWGPGGYENQADFWSLGVGTHISFVFVETSALTASRPQILGAGAQLDIGAFAVYGLDLQFVPIGV